RAVSHSLSNHLVLQQDLIKAIEAETQRLRKNSRLSIQLTAEKSKRTFNTNEKVIVYRIFQEITNNILKHSKATAIEIVIKTEPFLAITVKDKGQGLFANQDQTTLGLQGMVARAEVINYKITIGSTPGKGTTVLLSER